MDAANCDQTLAPALSLPILQRSVLPILKALVSDPIPNIRFNVARSYAVLINIFRKVSDDTSTLVELEKAGKAETAQGSAKGEQVIREEITPQLDRLIGDEDVDVRYYASIAGKHSGVSADADAMET